jgi:GNAT superfamily N-acetyltransferase
MSTTFGFLIRDGLESDISGCLALDHSYESEYVWQMSIREETGQWEVRFKPDRLPRMVQAVYPFDEKRIRLSLPPDQCFLVAVGRDQPDVLGYLTMRTDHAYGVARLMDLVVARSYRNQRIATRLLNIARQWAREHGLTQISMEIQTKNYPGILFCQQRGFAFCGFNDRLFPNQDIAVFFSQSVS